MSSKVTRQTPADAVKLLKEFIPESSYVLFTPHGGMVVSPDPLDIKRTLNVILASSGKESI